MLFSILKKLIKKIRSAKIRFRQFFIRYYVWLVNTCTSLLVDKLWLIDYLPKSKSGRKAILLVRLDLIGDFIIWLDAAKEFKKLYPDKRIVLYANAVWAPLAEQLSYWDEVVSVDMTRLRDDAVYRFKLLCRVHICGFDTAIQPTYSREYVADLVVRASNARLRVGHDGDTNNISPENKVITDSWYTLRVPQVILPEIELNINAELIRALGNKNFRSRIPCLEKLDDLPAELLIANDYVVIVPGASWGPKMWPNVNFAELACKISNSCDLTIVLCGTQSERGICNNIAERSGVDMINLSGLTTLNQMIEIIRNASLLIANDSASIHIAAATRTPSVCILGGGHFGRFLPYQPEVKESNQLQPVSIFQSMSCFGCRWRCQYPLSLEKVVPCISEIEVDKVLKACNFFILNRGVVS